jgi:hypothetical protein
MATYRRPKGSYTRPTPDFFINSACTVGGVTSAAAGTGAALDLYNNALDGSSLHVYTVWVGNDASELYGITALHGHGGTFLANGVSVIVPGPTPWGQLYVDTVPAQWSGTFYPAGTSLSDRLYMNDVAGSQDRWHTGGPICVLSPGYALRVYGATGSGTTGTSPVAVSFYYLQIRDQG